MRVLQGTVVEGRIVVEGHPLTEGATVTVVDDGDQEPYRLSANEEALPEAGADEIRRGEYVTAEELLADIADARR